MNNNRNYNLSWVQFEVNNPDKELAFENMCVNVNIRMYNFDDVQCTVIPSVAYGFVTGMNLQ
ncbi:MAG: hypothetical protein E7F96_09120, partial [Veillonella sp.]|uniref:hypothetical protein n=1 Tax=Veillonella sp. TaxID=1926307 RepID=UPI0029079D11